MGAVMKAYTHLIDPFAMVFPSIANILVCKVGFGLGMQVILG